MERVIQSKNIKETINNLKDTGKLEDTFRQGGDEQPGRAMYLIKLSKAQVEILHKWEIERGRVVPPSQFRKHFRLSRVKYSSNEHYIEIITELNDRRPQKVEPRECTKCFNRWADCPTKINGKCTALYTDLEYIHAWDWNIFYSSPKEIFDRKARKSKLIEEVES